MQKNTKLELIEALKEFGVISKNDLPNALKEYGVISKNDLPNVLKEYGVISKSDLPNALKEYGVATKEDIVASENRTDLKLQRMERRLVIKITKSKNDLAQRIAGVAVAKEERSKVEKIESRVTTLENFVYA